LIIIAKTTSGKRVLDRGWAIWPAALAFALLLLLVSATAASAETRTLKLHFTHTNERAEITFKRNGRYIREGLQQINWILRDWRRDEATEMDPRLLDLLWEVYQQSGSRAYIHVISAYRSPATNQMLRSRSSGVADNSQHTRGRAIDFFLPDVPPARLRELGLRHHGGGVGYYPRSGSPFVHLDTGSVRHWPRMNRQQLMAVFPDGRTIHVPSDGRPLPGYQQALAAYEARQRGQAPVQVASAGSSSSASSSGGGGGFLANLFRGGQQPAEAQPAQQPATRTASAPAAAPAPAAPVRQAQPEPSTPETILAALPPSRVPIPMAAPRPSVPVGAPAAAETAPAAPVPAAEPVAVAETIPFEVRDEAEIRQEIESRQQAQTAAIAPVPMPRPDRVAPADVVQTASVAETAEPALAALAATSRDAGGAAIEELLAARSAQPPVPVLRSRVTDAEAPTSGLLAGQDGGTPILLAALPDTRGNLALERNAGAGEAAAAKERALAAAGDSRLAPISAAASPRSAIISREPGLDAVAALDSGVRTTTKSARPSRETVTTTHRRPHVVPIEADHTRWAFESRTIASVSEATRAPSFLPSALRSAPSTVYTTGFQQMAVVESNRFSGQAVRFLSVARFSAN